MIFLIFIITKDQNWQTVMIILYKDEKKYKQPCFSIPEKNYGLLGELSIDREFPNRKFK
jgi:hypothetical protein